jgi:hypothetical protein
LHKTQSKLTKTNKNTTINQQGKWTIIKVFKNNGKKGHIIEENQPILKYASHITMKPPQWQD